MPFDINRLEVTGQPVSIVRGVLSTTEGSASWFDVSDTGTLVYVPGQQAGNDVPLMWMRRDGITPLRAEPLDWRNPKFAPDGRRLAFNIEDGGQLDVWVYEWVRGQMARLTTDPALDTEPVWSPDGRAIAFASSRGDKQTLNLYWQSSDGASDAHRLTESRQDQRPNSWHPSGRYLAYQEQISPGQNRLMVLPLQASGSSWTAGTPTPFLTQDKANSMNAAFSLDGQWLAYQSNEAGRAEIFVRPFPDSGRRWQISTSGGRVPTWSKRRNELFYVSDDFHVMVVPYTVEGGSFHASPPQRWSDQPVRSRPGGRWLDLHPDGDRFVVNATPPAATNTTIDKVVLVTNFFDELRRLVK